MKKIIFTSLAILLFQLLFSQDNINSNIWYFGGNAGLNFNSGTPVALIDGAMNHIEGCSTICDSVGNLLFYTDGQKIWNKLHSVMPNGNNLMGHNSATQSSIIVPQPGNANLFFVFTVDAAENQLSNGLRYSIVNLTLDGGNGDVVTTSKNLLLHTPVPEKITAILDTYETGYWVLSHEWGSNAFLAYHLTSTGLNTTPVISNVGSIHSGGANPDYPPLDGWQNSLGYIRANRGGNKIAVARFRAPIELFDFNRFTGIVSNPITAPVTYDQSYGLEFSPDQSKLYLSTISSSWGTQNKVYQFDLFSSNPLTSPILIKTAVYQPSAIQVGPDGKIYVSEFNYYTPYNNYLAVISNPNGTGTSCNYITNGVYLAGKIAKRGLPNLFYYKGFQFITESCETSLDKSIKIYPNPVNDLLKIENNKSQPVILQIFDLLGKNIFCDTFNEEFHSVNCSMLPRGIYLLKIISNKETTIKKILIEK